MRKNTVVENDELRMRILTLKDRLPRKYAERLQAKFPKYRNTVLIGKVYRVVALQIIDEQIISDLEKIVI